MPFGVGKNSLVANEKYELKEETSSWQASDKTVLASDEAIFPISQTPRPLLFLYILQCMVLPIL